MQRTQPLVGGYRTEPIVGASHPDFVWTPGGNVQATWRRFGWTPTSEQRQAANDAEKTSCETSQL